MTHFNLSQWAITHRALVLFMILMLGAAGDWSYLNLGRAEDPSFTIKTMVVNVAWPGATATEMQTQVADKIEKKLQELPWLDRVESYSQPGVSFIQVYLVDKTPPSRVKELWYQVRKKVGDVRGDLPAGVIGPNFPTQQTTGGVDNPTTLTWSFTIQYSLMYLQSAVKDVGLGVPFNRMVAVVEFPNETCLNTDCKNQTTSTVNPGIAWIGKYTELGIAAEIPTNTRSGAGTGVFALFHLFIDDLFPKSIGRPIFP
jgi:hypothetical protein